ncbi:hypothetical protein, partial [Ruminococcus sp.]|uniref:hypothetical protein n=1 Tax=Ruminococcus sp. TaxID=41978 RepID=UPI003EFCFA90
STMKTIKKQISVLLAVMMILCSFTAISFSASAAETTGGTITVNSNLCDAQTYNYTANDKQIEVTYFLQCDNMILNTQGGIYYDSSVLSVADTNTAQTSFPGFASGQYFVNFDLTNKALYNATSLNLYDFTTKGVFFTVVFDIVGSGDTEVNLDVDVITATTANDFDELEGASDIDLVYYGDIAADKFSFSSESKLIKDADSVTLQFAAPTSYASRNTWSNPVFFYGDTQSIDSVTKVEMTATGDVYYTTDTGSNTLLTTTNGWKVFEVTLSADEVTAANASKFAGFATSDGVNRTTLVSGANVLKAGVDTYSATYGTAKTLGELNGKTFVIKDSTYGEKSCTSYVGYWVSEYVTVKVASPLSSTTYSTWDKASLYYGDTTTFDNMTKIEMINTGETTKVTGVDTVKTLKSGRWYINAITVDTATAAAINSAKYAGFCKTDAVNRTSILMNVLKAKTNVCDGSYNSTARTLADVAGQVFVIKDKTSTVETSVSTYIGEWETEDVYTQGKDDTVTIYFAAPKGAKSAYDWNTGVELYYGNTAIYTATERLAMTKTDKTVNVSANADKIPTLASGDWTVYSLTLTVDQIKAIDNSANVGFVKTGSYNRTSILSYRNIGKASKMDGVTTYNGVKESIETFDGYVFVINDHYPSSSESISYTGSWVAA